MNKQEEQRATDEELSQGQVVMMNEFTLEQVLQTEELDFEYLSTSG